MLEKMILILHTSYTLIVKTALLWERLRGFFKDPEATFSLIAKEYHVSALSIIKEYFLFFLILIPVLFSFKAFIITSFSLKIAFKTFFIVSFGFLLYLVFLYFLGLLLDEVGYYFGVRSSQIYGIKICFFSALPFCGFLTLSILPYIGKIFVICGFFYHLYLIYKGCFVVMLIDKKMLNKWLLMIIFSISLLLGILIVILKFIQKMSGV